MPQEFDVVVIGSGGTGAATAYALAKRPGLKVALLDKHEIVSQTSPRTTTTARVPSPEKTGVENMTATSLLRSDSLMRVS